MVTQLTRCAARSNLLENDRAMAAMRKYFEFLHSSPGLAFLHRASVMRLYRERNLEQSLLAAIVAVASRVPGTPVVEQEVGFQCADMAERLILDTFKQPSIFNTQALLLLLKFRLWTGAVNTTFLLMSQLTRFAFALRLNYETLKSSFFVQESRRRLMWAVYMLDVALADGHLEFTTCPITAIHLRLPSKEDDFELDIENASEQIQNRSNPSANLGIIAYYLRVVHLHDEILRLCLKVACRDGS